MSDQYGYSLKIEQVVQWELRSLFSSRGLVFHRGTVVPEAGLPFCLLPIKELRKSRESTINLRSLR